MEFVDVLFEKLIRWTKNTDDECPVDLELKVKMVVCAIISTTVLLTTIVELIILYFLERYDESAFEISTDDYGMIMGVRIDLNMPAWSLVTQTTHSALKAYEQAKTTHKSQKHHWDKQLQRKRIVEITSDAIIRDFKNQCERDNINYFVSEYNGEYAVIAMGPARMVDLNKIVPGYIQFS